jgi:valyl-tRNA synthetase
MDDFGTDALRFTLLVGATPGNDMNLSVKKVEANRNFANKIWNAGRFVINAIDSLALLQLPPFSEKMGEEKEGDNSTLADSWIWAKSQQLIRDMERLFQTFQYGEAGRQIYEFFWSDFADWYVEIAKEQMKNDKMKEQTVITLARILDMSLRLLHPFTPFVTEEVWGYLRKALLDSSIANLALDWPDALIMARWPEPREPENWEESILQSYGKIQEIIRSIRNWRAENNIKPSLKFQTILLNNDDEDFDLLQKNANVISGLTGTYSPEIIKYLDSQPENHFSFVSGSTNIYLPQAGMGDAKEELTHRKQEKELAEIESQIERLEKLLSSDFANKAPASVVGKEREKLAGYKETAENIKAQLK